MMSNTKNAIFRAKTSLGRVISSSLSTKAAPTWESFSTTQPPRILSGAHSFCKNMGISENSSVFCNNRRNIYGFGRVGVAQIRELSGGNDSGLEEGIKKTISDNPVVVYSKTYCPFSSEVKFLFKRLDVDAHIIELDQLGNEGSEMLKVLKRLTDQHTVPNVFIGGKHIGGCSDILKLYKDGELEDLLAEAEA